MGAVVVVAGVALAPAAASGTGADGLTCLDGVRVVDGCPPVPVSVSVEVVRSGRALDVRLANEGDERWPGGPVAVELPVLGATVDEPAGTVPRSPSSGWRTVNGVVVARCEVVTDGVAPGASAGCRLPLLGARDGVHELWITGFRAAVADSPDLGTTPAAPGVVPVATARSLRFRLEGGRATILAPGGGEDGGGPVQATGPVTTAAPGSSAPATPDAQRSAPASGDGSAAPLVAAVAALLALLAVLAAAVRWRPRRGEARSAQPSRNERTMVQTPRHSEREPS